MDNAHLLKEINNLKAELERIRSTSRIKYRAIRKDIVADVTSARLLRVFEKVDYYATASELANRSIHWASIIKTLRSDNKAAAEAVLVEAGIAYIKLKNNGFRFYKADAQEPEPNHNKATTASDTEALVVPYEIEAGQEMLSSKLRSVSRAWSRTVDRLKLGFPNPDRIVAERTVKALGITWRYVGKTNTMIFFKLIAKDANHGTRI